MNSVNLIGRLVKDPELRRAGETSVCTFTLAIDRPVKAGAEKQTDYPRVTCFGKTAENCDKYLGKGRMCAVQGRLQTGSYEKDGHKVFTTDVIADRVEFIDRGEKQAVNENKPATEPTPEGFSQLDESIPF